MPAAMGILPKSRKSFPNLENPSQILKILENLTDFLGNLGNLADSLPDLASRAPNLRAHAGSSQSDDPKISVPGPWKPVENIFGGMHDFGVPDFGSF